MSYLRTTVFVGVVSLLFLLPGCKWFTKKPKVQSYRAVVPVPTGTGGRTSADNAKMDLGVGFDSVAAEVRQRCVDVSHATLSPETGAGDSSLSLDTASDLETVAKKLDVTASGSFGSGVYSGDASFNYMKSGKFSKYGEYLMITQRVENERQLYETTKITLNDTGKRILKGKNPLWEFRRVCGDQFFVGKITGGSLSAMLRLDSSSAEEQEQMHASFSGHGPNFDVSVDTTNKLDTFRKSQQLHVDILRQGPVENWPDNTVEALIQYAKEFPCKVATKKCGPLPGKDGSIPPNTPEPTPYTIAFIATSYDELLGDIIVAPEQREFFDNEAVYARALYGRLAGLNYINSNPSQFGPFSTSRIEKEMSTISAEITRILELVRKCGSDKSSCKDDSRITVGTLPPKLPKKPWVDVDLTANKGTLYGSALGDDIKVIEIQGRWHPHCPNKAVKEDHYRLRFIDRKTAVATIVLYPGIPVIIPRNSDVYVGAADGPENNPDVWSDNCKVDNETPQVRIFVPLYADEFRDVSSLKAE